MTAARGFMLFCDFTLGSNRDGSIIHCPETIEVMPADNATEARGVVESEGWSYRRKRDLCPRHR